jgi:hypothetical protein
LYLKQKPEKSGIIYTMIKCYIAINLLYLRHVRKWWHYIHNWAMVFNATFNFLVGTISNVLVMEIGWTDVGSGGYILVSCAHSNTSFMTGAVVIVWLLDLQLPKQSVPITWSQYNWNIVESGIKHHSPIVYIMSPFSNVSQIQQIYSYITPHICPTYFHNQNITDCSDQKWKGPSSLHR